MKKWAKFSDWSSGNVDVHLLQLHLLGQVHIWTKPIRETKVLPLFQDSGYPTDLEKGNIEARLFLLLMQVWQLAQQGEKIAEPKQTQRNPVRTEDAAHPLWLSVLFNDLLKLQVFLFSLKSPESPV